MRAPEFYKIHIDECQILIYEIIQRAAKDFLTLSQATSISDRYDYETACQFLFDDSYRIDYGDTVKSLRDLADIIGLDVEWIRETIMKGKDYLIRKRKAQEREPPNETEEEV